MADLLAALQRSVDDARDRARAVRALQAESVPEFWIAPDAGGDLHIWRAATCTPYLSRSEVRAGYDDPDGAHAERLWALLTTNIPTSPICQTKNCGDALFCDAGKHCPTHTPDQEITQ
jgi:hypothetical protein